MLKWISEWVGRDREEGHGLGLFGKACEEIDDAYNAFAERVIESLDQE